MLKLEGINKIVHFKVGGQSFGIQLSDIDTIIRAVEVTPVPNSPEYLCGIIDMHGVVLPVISFHVRIGLPDRPTSIDDRFIIARVPGKVIALRVEEVTDVVETGENHFLDGEAISSDLEIHGVVRSKEGMIVIWDLEKFLSCDELSLLESLTKDLKTNN